MSNRCIYAVFCLAFFVLFLPMKNSASDQITRDEVLAAMKKASYFMMDKVSNHGGFVSVYNSSLSEQWGEIPARDSQIWVQSPGTTSMGMVMLKAYEITKDPDYLQYAKKIANALIYGQHKEGGWHYFIDFDPQGIEEYYEDIASQSWGFEEYYHYYGNCTYDDSVHTEPTRFLMKLYLSHLDSEYKVPLVKALNFILESQFSNGAWPQRYPLHEGYTSYYTYNDNVIFGNIYLLLDAYEKLGNQEYKKAAQRGMDFVIISQLPPPQAGWAQQYNHDMKPGKARNFEPAAVSTGTTRSCIRNLEKFYMITGNKKYLRGIPDAIQWLEDSIINRDINKTYKGRKYTHASFYELGTNKPLYPHRKDTRAELDPNDPNKGYWVDYEFGNFPGHYGMITYVDLEAIKEKYNRIKSLSPEEAMSEYQREKNILSIPEQVSPQEIRDILSSRDKRGIWVEEVFIKHYPDFRNRAKGKTIKGIRTRTYQENMMKMLTYLQKNSSSS